MNVVKDEVLEDKVNFVKKNPTLVDNQKIED